MTFQLKDFHYDLDKRLIAQHPIEDRAASKLLIMDKHTGQMTEGVFADIVQYIKKGDTLVLNDSKVIPARLHGKLDTGGKIEILLLEEIETDLWEVLCNPGKKATIGRDVFFEDGTITMKARVVDILKTGNRLVQLSYTEPWEMVINQLGEMPLPPYITAPLVDKDRYQTIFARDAGSAAAPTAGLHFTKELLARLEAKGVRIAYVTLHVGLGTFRPVKGSIENHVMHEEWYSISPETAQILNETKENKQKIIAVGSTSCRTLEGGISEHGVFEAKTGRTSIFIKPGYTFKAIDELITNFHLPESTLLMLVSALSSREHIFNAYELAKAHEYRFFSFGDAMFIRNGIEKKI